MSFPLTPRLIALNDLELL